jgi:hypothetical protein
LALHLSTAFGATTTWTDGTSSWFTSTNWDHGEPDTSTDAQINNGGTAQIITDVPQAVALSLTLALNSDQSGTAQVSAPHGGLSVGQANLRKSQLVTDQRGSPITASELQAEMDCMASHTKQPEVLREIFETLGNDSFVIAECLARPALAERLVTNVRLSPTSRWSDGRVPSVIAMSGVDYTLSKISQGPGGCTDDSWTATTVASAPDIRANHTAVWTGSEMIVWGGTIPTVAK